MREGGREGGRGKRVEGREKRDRGWEGGKQDHSVDCFRLPVTQ